MKPLDASIQSLGVALALSTAAKAQTIIHVDDDAPDHGDGSTWESAFNDLQDAIAAIDAVNNPGTYEIRIADGTYRPDRGTGNPSMAFEVGNDELQSAVTLNIRGGFAGLLSLTDPDRQDPSIFKSILDGDLNGDDLSGFRRREDNSWSVLKISDSGAGPVTIADLIVRGANEGQAVLTGAWAFWSGCTFTDNSSPYSTIDVQYFVRFTNCLFVGNRTRDHGVLSGVGMDLINCVIAYNDAGLATAEDVIVYNSLIYGNTTFGVGISITPLLINSILWANGHFNEMDQLGGGIPLHCIIERYRGRDNGNTSQDPRFIDVLGPDGILRSGDEDLRVRYHSPSRDAGLMGLLPRDSTDLDNDGDFLEPIPIDLANHARILNRSLDIGPYEICPPDMTGSSDPRDPTYDIPNGSIDADDWFFFLDMFVLADERADLTGSDNPDDPDYGVPDGNISVDDYFFFLDAFARGCDPD